MDLGTAFAASAARRPAATALVDGATRLDYAGWDRIVRATAGGLRGLGLAQGDRLVVVLANRHEMATLYWACQMLGVVFTPFNWRASADEIAYALADAAPGAVVFGAPSGEAVRAAAARTGIAGSRLIAVDAPVGDELPFAALGAGNALAGPVGLDDAAISLMLYTSGTTGRPKGVPRAHRAEREAALACLAQLRYRAGERMLGVMPLFHTMGVRALLMSGMLNGAFVAMARFDAARAMALIEEEKIEALFLVPTMFHDIVGHADRARFDLGSVRNIGFAGASMTSDLTRRCQEIFRPESFCNYYGSSEIYTFAVCDHVAEKPGCAGPASLNQMLRIVRAAADQRVGPDEGVDAGEIGEIIATMQSPEAFTGYWKRPDADAAAIRDGWYYTGDLGYIDTDGELHIVGRLDDMIISGGENIHAEEVEDVLDRSPLVKRVAVVGLADARLGQKVVAFIEPASDKTSAAALDAACLASPLARFKRPRAYVFVADIPKSASGKILRRLLRDGAYDVLTDFTSTLEGE
jgi:2-furoate---CoA ligase